MNKVWTAILIVSVFCLGQYITYRLGLEDGAKQARDASMLLCVFNMQGAPVAFALHTCNNLLNYQQ